MEMGLIFPYYYYTVNGVDGSDEKIPAPQVTEFFKNPRVFLKKVVGIGCIVKIACWLAEADSTERFTDNQIVHPKGFQRKNFSLSV